MFEVWTNKPICLLFCHAGHLLFTYLFYSIAGHLLFTYLSSIEYTCLQLLCVRIFYWCFSLIFKFWKIEGSSFEYWKSINFNKSHAFKWQGNRWYHFNYFIPFVCITLFPPFFKHPCSWLLHLPVWLRGGSSVRVASAWPPQERRKQQEVAQNLLGKSFYMKICLYTIFVQCVYNLSSEITLFSVSTLVKVVSSLLTNLRTYIFIYWSRYVGTNNYCCAYCKIMWILFAVTLCKSSCLLPFNIEMFQWLQVT